VRVSEEKLRTHVRYLSSPALKGREFGSEGNKMAIEYVRRFFREYGLQAPDKYPDYIQELPQGGQNAIGMLPGTHELSEGYLIVDAHHDHLGNGFVGSSDNAAGVAVVLELARIFSEEKINKHTLLFTCFEAEEQLLLINNRQQIMYGASQYIEKPAADLRKTIAMITLDTLGRSDLFDSVILILGTEHSLFIQEAVYGCSTELRKILFSLDLLTGIKGNYIPFLERKIPSLFISNGIHQDYHSRNDTEDKLQYGLLRKDTEFTFELISRIANSDERPDFCKNPIPPKSEAQDILYLMKTLQGLVLKTHGDAQQFNYIIRRLEEKSSPKDLNQAVQILLGFMAPNFARFYILLNDAQMAEKRKEYSIALRYYKEIVAFNDTYRVPYLWMEGIREKITKLEEKVKRHEIK
jgi:hypothetical protein